VGWGLGINSVEKVGMRINSVKKVGMEMQLSSPKYGE